MLWSRLARSNGPVFASRPLQPKKRSALQKIGIAVVAGGAGLYTYDYMFNASAITRAVRSIYNIMYIGFDYKLNFKEGRDINALHSRSADRLYTLLVKNKGLYIKMGQAIAIQEGIFPPSFQEKFKQLFDSAPQDSWKEIETMFRQEFGQSPDTFFDYIDHRAFASASISQVHKARLKNGDWVAVKLQHCDIQKQMYWDLLAYRSMMYFYEKVLFKVPLYFVAEHISSRISQEVDFKHEVYNSESLRKYVETDPKFRHGQVYIPRVYPDLCSQRVIVSEWIDGVPLNRKTELKKQRFNMKQALDTLFNLFAKQMFEYGILHCDPHPGNIFLRWDPRPGRKGQQQLVLLDHGLYVEETERFRKQYALLWRSMFVLDTEQVRKVTEEWGLGNAEFFASSTMLQSYGRGVTQRSDADIYHERAKDGIHHHVRPSKDEEAKKEFEEQRKASDVFKSFIRDTTKVPLDIIFLGRTMRILQGLNRMFGSPVNRVKIFAFTASRAATAEKHIGIKGFFLAWKDHLVFWFTVNATELMFWLIWVKRMFIPSTPDVEEVFEDQMVDTIQNAMH